jgi:hypothetical protein
MWRKENLLGRREANGSCKDRRNEWIRPERPQFICLLLAKTRRGSADMNIYE